MRSIDTRGPTTDNDESSYKDVELLLNRPLSKRNEVGLGTIS